MGSYNPPNSPDGKREYDRSWNENHAKRDFDERKYSPPDSPSDSSTDKKDYDRQWNREQAKRDYGR